MAEKYTYSDTTTQIRSVVPEFDFLSPKEVPFLKLISGGAEDKPSLNSLSEPCTATKYEWMEDVDPPVKTALQGAVTNVATTLGVTAADSPYIVADQIIQVDTEQMRVTANDGLNGATSLTVTRAWGGTTAAAHNDLTTVYVVGRAHIEGADAPADSYMYPTMPYNYVQEMVATILLSELEQAIKRYGIDDAVEYETQKKARSLFIMMERQCFYGNRVQGNSTTPGAFGNLDTFIASSHVKSLSNGALTTAAISDRLQGIYDDVGMVGMPNTIVCGSWVRRKISSIYGSTGVTTFRDQQERRGGVLVDTIQTEFTDLDIVLSPWCDPTKLYLLKTDKLGIGPLEGKEFRREMLAKTGTSDKWMISGAYTLQCRGSKYHAAITDISLTS